MFVWVGGAALGRARAATPPPRLSQLTAVTNCVPAAKRVDFNLLLNRRAYLAVLVNGAVLFEAPLPAVCASG